MEIVNGKHNKAIIFTNDVETEALSQIKDICDDPSFTNSRIRIMPDVHAGKGCTIGTTMTLEDKAVIPNHVGVDIGCGVTAVRLKDKEIDYAKVEEAIVNHVPSGFNTHFIAPEMSILLKVKLLNLKFLQHLPDEERDKIFYRAIDSYGTLGGGNHFIEIDENPETGDKILVVHTGSRQLGNKCCQYYQKQIGKTSKLERKQLISDLKRQNRESEIQTELIKLSSKPQNVLTGSLYDDYIHDIKIIQGYAFFNRTAILKAILENTGLEIANPIPINSTHNYIDTTVNPPILRKGAIAAYKDQEVIIPFNMRDGVVIAWGLGNEEWNCSAPHGAGRKMSRRKAFNELSLDEFKDQMKGIYTESVDSSTLDEAPGAYKDFEEIYNLVLDQTISDPVLYKPVYNYKHHESN